MKNSINFVIVIFVAVVLGCSCPNMDEKTDERNVSSPNNSTRTENPKNVSITKNNTDETPKLANSNRTSKPVVDDDETNDDNLTNSGIPTMNQFRQIYNGMEYDRVVKILGSSGNLIKTTPSGGKRYVWGDNNAFIMISFEDDKVMLATQHNLK